MSAPSPLNASVLLEDEQNRARARERLYVLFQSCGWLGFLGLQAFFILFSPQQGSPLNDRLTGLCIVTMVVTLGWLITHFSRALMARWGWKNLGWRALVPRLVLLSMLQSGLWGALGYTYPYVVLHFDWSSRIPLGVALLVTWINGVILLFGWLCIYYFYHLFDSYNRLKLEQLTLATTVKEAELRALKSQVNPHFIFNSLNSLRALIEEEPARAREAVTQLANLLRYSLQSGQLETVPFSDELRIVNDYLALEQVRHEERLRVRLDIAADTLALPIPPMLLQTLVENAVKYGISTRPEGGEIAITARRENDALRLQVSNPGRLLVEPLQATRVDRKGASTGLGLRNAAERLRLLFGDQATLQVRSAEPELVVAEAVLPLHTARA